MLVLPLGLLLSIFLARVSSLEEASTDYLIASSLADASKDDHTHAHLNSSKNHATSKLESCKSFMAFKCAQLPADKQDDCVKTMFQKCEELVHGKKASGQSDANSNGTPVVADSQHGKKASGQSGANSSGTPAVADPQNYMDDYKHFVGGYSGYMDSFSKKFMVGGKGGSFQKYMGWANSTGAGKNSSGYQKYMDWQKYTGSGKNSSGVQQYMDWQKFMGGAGKNSSYQKYMDWQKFTTALSSKEHNNDSLKYTPTSLALLFCAAGAFAAGFVFTREKLRRRRDSSTDYTILA